MSQYVGGFDFGEALRQLGRGERVARIGWNGKGMYLFMVPDSDWEIYAGPRGTQDLHRAPFIAMKTADNKIVPWLASQTDILAADWEVIGG